VSAGGYDAKRFVIGYDRAYIGAALHCLDCIESGAITEHEELHEITDATLDAVEQFAYQHWVTHHSSGTELT